MKLSNILKIIRPIDIDPNGRNDKMDLEVGSIHYRAQNVKPGGLFVAIPGHTADGHDFIDEAVKMGAIAIITEKKVKKRTLIIQVANTRQALAEIAAGFYGNPSTQLVVIGITGTNGKTTTAYLIESILKKAGYNVGVIGTINYRYLGKSFDNPITTPESLDLQRILADMRQNGVTHVVLEASSHAIDLYRIKSCWFDVAVFVNLSQDHLDFHGNMQSYWASKKRLFTEYLASGPKKEQALAVINCTNSNGRELVEILEGAVITTGSASDNTVRIAASQCNMNGIRAQILIPNGKFNFQSSLAGEHNLENILCATGVGVALKLSPITIKSGIEAVAAIPGRLERIENDSGRFVYVDYAHTPDALENVIQSLRAISTNRIICVFGCGGDRDKQKRPVMGKIAAQFCDLAVVTSDNPRTETPMAIIDHILSGIVEVNSQAYSPSDLHHGFKVKGYVVEPDRQRAIQLGILISEPGDTVLIAGKGHETYQIMGTSIIGFDDREEARKALRAIRS